MRPAYTKYSWLLTLLGLGADVITISTGTAGVAGNVSAALITYLTAKLLEVAELNTILDQFGEKVTLPAGNSRTIRFNRLEKFPVSASPSQLTEGIPPSARGLVLNPIEAVMEQYGDLVRISEVAELTAGNPIVAKTIYNLGLQAAEIYDQLIFNVLDAATNVYRPNGRAADTDLVGSDHVQYVDLIQLSAILQDAGARTFPGGDYVFVLAPNVHAALLNDPDFKAAAQFGAPERIWRGEVAMLGGFRCVRTNSPAFAATLQAGSGDASKVYSSFALGTDVYSVVDLQSLRAYSVAPGGHTDPLEQSRKLGWKFMTKSVITNQTWIRRVRSAGLDSVTNP